MTAARLCQLSRHRRRQMTKRLRLPFRLSVSAELSVSAGRSAQRDGRHLNGVAVYRIARLSPERNKGARRQRRCSQAAGGRTVSSAYSAYVSEALFCQSFVSRRVRSILFIKGSRGGVERLGLRLGSCCFSPPSRARSAGKNNNRFVFNLRTKMWFNLNCCFAVVVTRADARSWCSEPKLDAGFAARRICDRLARRARRAVGGA